MSICRLRSIARGGTNVGVIAQASIRLPRRSFASVANGADTDKLPLAGIRVLDMTRVLAGVRIPALQDRKSLLLTSMMYCSRMQLSFSVTSGTRNALVCLLLR